jgi:hypothetical protein
VDTDGDGDDQQRLVVDLDTSVAVVDRTSTIDNKVFAQPVTFSLPYVETVKKFDNSKYQDLLLGKDFIVGVHGVCGFTFSCVLILKFLYARIQPPLYPLLMCSGYKHNTRLYIVMLWQTTVLFCFQNALISTFGLYILLVRLL